MLSKLKIVTIIVASFFLLSFYGWRCAASKGVSKKHHNETSQTTTAESSGVLDPATSAEGGEATGSASASLTISTAHAVPLYKDIHSACTVDIFFGKKQQDRDILNDPYFSFIRSFNFTSLQYSGGSTADHDHVIVGDTRISGGKGDGYNISAEDCRNRGEDINSILGGIGNIHFGKDFFNEYCALLNKLGIPGDVIANVQGGTLDELIWKIKQSHARRVIFGMEQNLPSNAKDFPDGAAYKAKLTRWIETVKQQFPDVIVVLDAAPVYRGNERFGAWNKAIAAMPGDAVRMYLWDKDAITWQPDQQQNLASMDEAFSQTYPSWIEKVKREFPGKKVSVWQWGLKPKTDIFNTMAACIYIGEFYRFVIDYNKRTDNFIEYAAYMSLKSLNRGNGYDLNHALALQACGKLFVGNKNVCDLTIGGLNGVDGNACSDAGKYMLLLINKTGSTVNIPNLSVDGVPVQGRQFALTSVHANDLGSQDVAMDTRTVSSLTLPAYSVNIVSF